MTKRPFHPAGVLIPVTLDYAQMNLVLEGLGKLPFERVEQLYIGLRGHAAQVVMAAEQEHYAPTKPAGFPDPADPTPDQQLNPQEGARP